MQTPSEEDLSRKKNAQRRVEEHMRWKASFFQSRPPPQFIPKRRQRRVPIANSPVHLLHKRALDIVAAERLMPAASSTLVRPAVAVDEPATRQTIWLKQMEDEKERRNPYTDIKICSDPLCTVVVSRLHAKTVEEDVRMFCDQFGRVLGVRLIFDHKGRSRRYAFVQFGRGVEVKRATGNSGKKWLHGKAVVIDVERGRKQPGFLPKRIFTAMQLRVKSVPFPRTMPPRLLPQASASVTDKTLGSKSHGESQMTGDEVDNLLDDIMSIT
uniref:Uncharacterized protein TCIL3000_8_4530 n=1 Tax=Trypanosoma congolense (strain IL3000) TaxID=1068625 RepID=G0US70_TRYCI|nr:unnamed protein product [Trypanosoma congolense IL3000]